MSTSDTTQESRDLVFVEDGTVFTTSLEVAERFGKRHNNVLSAIRNLACSPEFGLLNFKETPYVDPQNGQTYPSYHITRDGFTFLAMGFTGKEAARWKELYIAAFNRMEAQLRASPPPQIDVRDPSQLASIAIQLIEVNKELEGRAEAAEAKVEEAKPKTEFYDRFASADGLYGLQAAARVLNERPNKFVAWLKQGYLFYQGGSLVPRAVYRDRGLFEVKATIIDDKARYRTFITPKGLRYFAEKLDKVNGSLGLDPREGEQGRSHSHEG